ncbi:hypothetical protein BDY19DRAFT_950596 [Irpex rosettiformis]|uniref:Uncharacterized protein n=1 Tax=Irpex rosettiformis TaxID=378272 RepID=A0ACB8U2S1_9APHY|nr:hypothetical protein BDY19DRAFT_950596 [Irpex rosettiformis]
MTRTERATSPRAMLKDRSESKTGIDKHTPKGGAGTHNWGSLKDERDIEEEAIYDEEQDIEKSEANVPPQPRRESKSSPPLSEEEKSQAVEYRKKALKSPDLDLGAIARTSSAVSNHSPEPVIPVTSDAATANRPY